MCFSVLVLREKFVSLFLGKFKLLIHMQLKIVQWNLFLKHIIVTERNYRGLVK